MEQDYIGALVRKFLSINPVRNTDHGFDHKIIPIFGQYRDHDRAGFKYECLKKAFQYQMEGKGFSLVEIVTSCPTNWGLDSLKALDYLEENMLTEYPLGVIRDKG